MTENETMIQNTCSANKRITDKSWKSIGNIITVERAGEIFEQDFIDEQKGNAVNYE